MRFTIFKRLFSTKRKIKCKICIVGSGPAGFYAAQHLAKKLTSLEIDIYEKLPVPFGLIRFGVAPDHPEVKNVINTFTKTAQLPEVRFIGNVSLGRDISLRQLKEAYHIVLLAYGAEKNRFLNIPGENSANVYPARDIVGWYNGTPWNADMHINLNNEVVAIFGQGNVGIDVARILLSPIDLLKQTDITQHSLELLAQSKIKEVLLIGRRGPLQAAFTIKEFREMLKLPDCTTVLKTVDFKNVNEIVEKLERPRKRLTQLMLDTLKASEIDSRNKRFKPTFYRSPIDIRPTKNEQILVNTSVNEMKDNVSVATDSKESFECDLVITSIGYKSVQADEDIPFDFNKGIVLNSDGKVDKNLYTSGWLATGPMGVILNTMNNAFLTAENIIRNMESDRVLEEEKPGFEEIHKFLKNKNVQIVTWNDWLRIDKYEKEQGKKLDKPREKIVDIRKMLEIVS